MNSASTLPVILCVDDETNPLTIRKFVLQRAGYHVITADSAKKALEIVGGTHIDLVLSDHLMPEMTGAELVARVKQIRPRLPFVLISGVNDLPAGAELADVFLSKLEGPEAMISNIRTLLKQ
jgi:CheY-like chemotaxis protein